MEHEQVREFFREMQEQEEMVFRIYEKLLFGIKNEKILRVIRQIAKDEVRHIDNVKKMLEILEE